MGAAVGIQTVLGIGEEVTYGTPVAPTKWYEIDSESIERQNQILTSSGLRRGARNLRRGSRRVISAVGASGDIQMPVAVAGFSTWFKHMLGDASVANTYKLGSLTGKSLTVQKSFADEAMTEVETFTYHGCKVTGWELATAVDSFLNLTVTVDAEDEDTSTAYATPTYGSAALFSFLGATLNIEGSAVANVLAASISGDNALKTDRYYLGSNGRKAEPVPNDFPTLEGTLDAEFLTPATFYDRFVADTPVELVMEFVNGSDTMTVTVPEIRFTGETPKAGGPEVIVQSVPFEGFYDGSAAGITIEYTEPA